MRICMLTSDSPPHCGGIGYHVHNIARRLAKRGHEVTIFTRGNWNQEWRRELIEGTEAYRVRYVPFYPFDVKLHGLYVNRLLKHLRRDFDVVHVHTPLIPFLNKLVPYIAIKRKKLVYSIVLPFLVIIEHFSLGFGFIHGLLSPYK